jgi:hypothetical protein
MKILAYFLDFFAFFAVFFFAIFVFPFLCKKRITLY